MSDGWSSRACSGTTPRCFWPLDGSLGVVFGPVAGSDGPEPDKRGCTFPERPPPHVEWKGSAVPPLAERSAVAARDDVAGRGPHPRTFRTVSSVSAKHSTCPIALTSMDPMRHATPSAGRAPKYSPSASTSVVSCFEPETFWRTSTQPSLMILTVFWSSAAWPQAMTSPSW